MKHTVLAGLLLSTLFFISGCSEKFNVAAPYKNITVIYAFLDQNDTAHYIRIQKAFLDQNKNSLVMATSPDSSFYSNLDVKVERIPYNGTKVFDTFHLVRVDLDQEGYPKQPGQFFQAPNYAYKFKNALDPQYIYRLIVTDLTTGKKDSVESPVISESPALFVVPYVDNPKLSLDFSSTLPGRLIDVQGYYSAPSDFLYEGLNNPAAIAQLIIRFHWDDSSIITHAHTPHYFDYNAGFYTLTPGGGFEYQIKNTDLYAALATVSGMGPAPANTVRLMDRSELFAYLGSYDFNLYRQSILTQGTGLTGTEIEPTFTNVKGDDALGLYTARAVRSGFVTITNSTIDSLELNPITKSINIVGTVYH